MDYFANDLVLIWNYSKETCVSIQVKRRKEAASERNLAYDPQVADLFPTSAGAYYSVPKSHGLDGHWAFVEKHPSLTPV